VRLIEFAGAIAQSSPGLDEVAFAVELQNTGSGTWGAGVTFADEDVAVGGNVYVIGLEQITGLTGAARLTDGHQVFASRAEFVHLVAQGLVSRAVGSRVVTAIGDPDVAFEVHVNAVGPHDQAFTEAG